jgi:hypothetical protein
MFIERNDQQMSDTKRANQSDLVRRSGKQMRRFVRPQYFFRVRIKVSTTGVPLPPERVSQKSK